jgi:hypothetical protein
MLIGRKKAAKNCGESVPILQGSGNGGQEKKRATWLPAWKLLPMD